MVGIFFLGVGRRKKPGKESIPWRKSGDHKVVIYVNFVYPFLFPLKVIVRANRYASIRFCKIWNEEHLSPSAMTPFREIRFDSEETRRIKRNRMRAVVFQCIRYIVPGFARIWID